MVATAPRADRDSAAARGRVPTTGDHAIATWYRRELLEDHTQLEEP